MICPYCEKEMQEGFVNQERMAIRWVPNEERGFMDCLLDRNVIKLTSLSSGGRVIVYHCADCKKFIVDENDIEV